jgi:CRP-like cAMP-binding protein
MLEEGEIVFAPQLPLLLSAPDFSVAVDKIPFSALFTDSGAAERVLAEVLEFYAQLWLRILGDVIQSAAQIIPSTRVFQAGETIITQGDAATEVYTLIEGEADVFVDGVKVGEVQTEEFFGILASITKAPRTATVVARTNCAVLCVATEKFQELIRARPVLIEKLVAELSRMVVNLNGKVVELSRSAP